MVKYFTVYKISMSHGRRSLSGSFSKSHVGYNFQMSETKFRSVININVPIGLKVIENIVSVSMNFLNSINIDDVSQGDVGDCWLLSSIIAVVNFGQDLINDIICLEENLKNPNGPFKFKFHKCGKWHSGRGKSAFLSLRCFETLLSI